MDETIGWLLDGEAFVRYRTRLDLLDASPDERAVRQDRSEMLADGRVQELVRELQTWPGPALSSHKSAGRLFHKLTFLADLGLRVDDPGIEHIVAAVLAHVSEEGPFQLLVNVPRHFGGTGQDVWAWALCDAPLSAYALVRLGLLDEPAVRKAVVYLAGLVRDNGWTCVVSQELGGFRGPGRKDDPCPFATLAMLKLLAVCDDLRGGEACRAGAETLLQLWSDSRSRHPYQFHMGTDFRKLKAPFVWYDLLHVLDVLTRFPWLAGDGRLRDMLEVLAGKADGQGRFTPPSVWTAWSDWEFAQKREPSRWVTLAALRIARRAAALPA